MRSSAQKAQANTVLIWVLFSCLSSFAHAEISLSSMGNESVAINNGEYAITQDLGVTAGNNLFHSFHSFNLAPGETATFSGATHIENVISRVTGGTVSNINGTIKNTIANANTYLFNPAGILFGKSAQLDVQGSFHASTADYLSFADGEKIYANTTQASQFSSAAPAKFGFLDASVASGVADMAITGSQLQADSLMLTGGDVSLTQQASLSVTNSVEVQADQFVLDNSSISVMRSGESAQDAAHILVNAKDISLQQGSSISSSSTEQAQGADIRLQAQNYLQIVGENTENQSTSLLIKAGASLTDTASSGTTHLQGKNVTLRDGGMVFSTILGTGRAGDIHLQADETILMTGTGNLQDGVPSGVFVEIHSQVDSEASTSNLSLQAPTITLTDDVEVSVFTAGPRQGGDIKVQANSLFMDNSDLMVGTIADGHVGSLDVQIEGDITLTKAAYFFSLSLGDGDAGPINVSADNINISKSAYVMSLARRTGNSGDVNIHATGRLSILGTPEDTDFVDEGWVGGIYSNISTFQGGIQGGDGGNIHVQAGELVLENGGQINTSSYSRLGLRSGNGGDVEINVTGNIDISGINRYGENSDGFASGIYARSLGVGGDGGNIRVTAHSINISDGGTITTSTDNYAPSGMIDIHVADAINISGNADHIPLKTPQSSQQRYLQEYTRGTDNRSISGIYANSEDKSFDSGRAGSIRLSANQLNLSQQGTISTSSAGGGKAGNITLNTPQIQLDKSAKIVSESLLGNRYTFADEAERDAALVVQGDVIEIADLGTGQQGHYINIGERLAQTRMPLASVPDVQSLYALSQQYRLIEGQIVTVDNVGKFIYTRHNRIEALNTWQRMDEQVGTVLSTLAPLQGLRIDAGYAPGDSLPNYQHGERIRVLDMGDGKPAEFIYTSIIDPSDNWTYARLVRVNQFEVNDVTALNALPKQNSFLEQMPIATLNTDSNTQHFVYANNHWIAFNNQHQVSDILALNALTVAKPGNQVTLHTPQNTQNQSLIYTGQGWITLNNQTQTFTIASLDELQTLSVADGTLVKHIDADTQQADNYFYYNQAWQQQQKGGNAGTIEVHSNTLTLAEQSRISTESLSGGGGGIVIHNSGNTQLKRSQITTSVQEGSGNGGDLSLNSQFVVQDHAPIIARAIEGNGGNIQIETKGIYAFANGTDSPIDASSQFGVSGNVELTTPDENISGSVFIVNGAFLKTAQLNLNQCTTARQVEDVSRFMQDMQQEGSAKSPISFQE